MEAINRKELKMQSYYTNSSYNSLFFNYKDNKNLSNSLWKTKKKELGAENKNYVYVNPELERIIRAKIECYGQKKSFTDHYLYFFSTVWYLSNVDRRYQAQTDCKTFAAGGKQIYH